LIEQFLSTTQKIARRAATEQSQRKSGGQTRHLSGLVTHRPTARLIGFFALE